MADCDRETRLCRWRLAAAGLLLICFAILLSILMSKRMQVLSLRHDRALISALLGEGVSETVLAKALKSPAETAEGAALLERLGWSASTALRDIPAARAFLSEALIVSLAAAAFFILLTAWITGRYFSGRERLYRQAADTLTRFLEGDGTARLPRGESGGVYTLLGRVDALVLMLQSRSEAERRAKDALKDAVSDISHQLKTPLAALRLYNDLTVGASDDPGAVRSFSEKAAVSLDRIERLIQTLLKVMRLDTGSVPFRREPCLVKDLAEKAAEELTTRAEREGKTLTLCGGAETTLVCDPQWTAEALMNLIKNALDYTRAGGHVSVRWARSPGFVRIDVADDGAGISGEDLPFLFKRFYRSENARDIQGVGLGLPLTKAVIEGQGGQVGVKSQPGQGSVFTVSFLTEP